MPWILLNGSGVGILIAYVIVAFTLLLAVSLAAIEYARRDRNEPWTWRYKLLEIPLAVLTVLFLGLLSVWYNLGSLSFFLGDPITLLFLVGVGAMVMAGALFLIALIIDFRRQTRLHVGAAVLGVGGLFAILLSVMSFWIQGL